jgi:hypothetical protein
VNRVFIALLKELTNSRGTSGAINIAPLAGLGNQANIGDRRRFARIRAQTLVL